MDRETLWNIPQHCGISVEFVNIIKNTYEAMTCKVAHRGKLTNAFEVRTGVKDATVSFSILAGN